MTSMTRSPLSLRLLIASLVLGSSLTGLAGSAAPSVAAVDAHLPGPSTAAVVGAYYYDGWAGPVDDNSPWFKGLLKGPYQTRRPLFGWSDDSDLSLQLQLHWARDAGVDFFAFDWYHDPENIRINKLNASWADNALQHYGNLKDHDRIRFALDYIDEVNGISDLTTWQRVVHTWVTTYFRDPSYQRVQGKPLLIINDAQVLANAFPRGAADARTALLELQLTAVANGLPGVYVVGNVRADSTHSIDLSTQGVHYDALSAYAYNYVFADGNVPIDAGEHPYADLVRACESVWDLFARSGPTPYVPVVEVNWDPRPWAEPLANKVFWFTASPDQFSSFARQGLRWLESNPTRRVEVQPLRPLMMVEAWNELGEGSYLVPTFGDGTDYIQALARARR
jgi:hypothetical protein